MIACQVEHNDYNKWPCECSINISHLTEDSHDSHNPTMVANLENDQSTNTPDFTASTAPPTDELKECMCVFFFYQSNETSLISIIL